MTETRPNVDYGDRDVAMRGQILRTTVGSGVHGIAIEGTDDHDEMGVYVEPIGMVAGLEAWSSPMNRVIHTEGYGMPNYIWRTQSEGSRSQPGDTDLVMHSLRKYLRLAAKGNPTALLPLWAPEEDVLYVNAAGEELRALRSAFMSRMAVERFLGFMHNQHERMMGRGKRNRVPNRPELVEKYGWDVKFGAHALRLAYQGYEIVTTGHLTLPMPPGSREHVLRVKRGEVDRDTVSEQITVLEDAIVRALSTSVLPDHPDWDAINAYAARTHLAYWQADTTPVVPQTPLLPPGDPSLPEAREGEFLVPMPDGITTLEAAQAHWAGVVAGYDLPYIPDGLPWQVRNLHETAALSGRVKVPPQHGHAHAPNGAGGVVCGVEVTAGTLMATNPAGVTCPTCAASLDRATCGTCGNPASPHPYRHPIDMRI